MKKLILLGAVVTVALLAGCASTNTQSPANNAAFTAPPTFNYLDSSINTTNRGSLFDPNERWEDNSL